MIAEMRREQIVEIIQEKKSATVVELAKEFGVTAETVRKDLKILDEEGKVTRTHGGAFIQEGLINEIDISIRADVHAEKKSMIASVCSGLLRNGDSIFFDSSTTAYCVAERVKELALRVTVLTNSLKICELFSESRDVRLILIGGCFSAKTQSFVDFTTPKILQNYYVDKAVISCRSVSQKHGVMDANEKTAEVRKIIIKQAEKVLLCVDSSKFDKLSFVKICDFGEIDNIITDELPGKEWEDFLDGNSVTVYRSRDIVES